VFYDFLRHYIAAPIVRHILRPKIVGLDRVPARGSAVLVSNHVSAGDTFPVTIVLRRRLYFPGKRALFTAKNPKGRFLAMLLRFAGQVPIDPKGGSSTHASLDKLVDLLRRGDLVGIFAEGTRSPDGRLYRFHTGAARLVLATGSPVIPMACVDTDLKRGFLGIPTMKDGTITLGEPLDFSDWVGRQDDLNVLRWVSDQIATVVQGMTGQAYVDIYASRVKSGELTPAEADEFVCDKPGAGVMRPLTNAELRQRG